MSTKVLVITGAGGVGKTTLSAALAVAAARRGLRTCVMTVDPARRLADALGIETLDNHPSEVTNQPGLSAAMLDVTASWEAMVHRHADPETAARLLVDPFFQKAVTKAQKPWRRIVSAAVEMGIPMPALSSALGYYDGYRCARLPANLLQAQRDYFGAHTYERTDRPRGEFSHTNWTGRGGETASSTYVV